jgi:hypothetical protein
MVILSGLTKAHITRLKKSWEVCRSCCNNATYHRLTTCIVSFSLVKIVDGRAKSKLRLMNELMGMESNYHHYRQALRYGQN